MTKQFAGAPEGLCRGRCMLLGHPCWRAEASGYLHHTVNQPDGFAWATNLWSSDQVGHTHFGDGHFCNTSAVKERVKASLLSPRQADPSSPEMSCPTMLDQQSFLKIV